MNVTFDLRELRGALAFLGKVRGARSRWLRVSATGDTLSCAAGAARVNLPALVLETGAFTAKRRPFEAVVGSYTGETMTIQADAKRFRIGAFSAALRDYAATPMEED